MISSLGYAILRTLAAYDKSWGTFTISKEVNASVRETRYAVSQLLDQELIEFKYGYRITEEGIDELNRAPNLTQRARRWASMVRQGINSSGHETRIRRAAIPNRYSPQIGYTPDMEGLIDALREGLGEYD